MKKKTVPVFEQIAYELACKIKNDELTLDQKIRGRSIIASEFSVSSETVRKALALLESFGVVNVKEQSGAYVKSKPAAIKYITSHHHKIDTQNKFNLIDDIITTTSESLKDLHSTFKEIKKNNDLRKSVLPISSFSIILQPYDSFLGKDFNRNEFVDLVKGNIFGVVRDNQIISGVKHDFSFLPGDEVFISGDESVKQKTLSFLKNPNLLK